MSEVGSIGRRANNNNNISFLVMMRTSEPETGDAVVAIRMIECDRLMSYPSIPHDADGHQSCTFLPIAWNMTRKATKRSSEAIRPS